MHHRRSLPGHVRLEVAQPNRKEVMKLPRPIIAVAALAALASAIAFSGVARPAPARAGGIASRSYVQTNLVSDIPGLAAHTDPNLKNPWGTSVGPGTPIWVSDNHAGLATLYDGAGKPQPRVVAIPAPPRPARVRSGRRTGKRSTLLTPIRRTSSSLRTASPVRPSSSSRPRTARSRAGTRTSTPRTQ
jgi:hypothetical protein